MVNVLAVGTLKRGFALHEQGLHDADYLGPYRTRDPLPMLIAGPWYAPMIFNQPGTGLQIIGELYRVSPAALARLDMLESVGRPGNSRIVVEVEPVGSGAACAAIVYVKSPELASPVHSGYLADYQDRRFIPPGER
jgi:gamma-glutamylaminecyclotransferase